MGKPQKAKTKKDKVVKAKQVSLAAGTYNVWKLVDGSWGEPETVKAKGRMALMKGFGGYSDNGLVNLNKPQIKVRAAI